MQPLRHRIANTLPPGLLGVLLSLLLVPALLSPTAQATVANATMADFTLYPAITTQSAVPIVMLAMSRDQQYFFKAYNDYNDLDGDGKPDLTYKNSFDYYGYFDPAKCYTYQGGMFVPVYFTSDHYCDDDSAQWSGNFLNWATMTRMDIVRRILYGGKRKIDTADETVLERAYLPDDAHSFAKYYDGADIDRLTPFDANLGAADPREHGITLCNTTDADSSQVSTSLNTDTYPPLVRVAQGNFSLWSASERWQCTWYGEHEASNSSQGRNSNDPSKSGIEAFQNSPHKSTDGLTDGTAGPDYNVLVEACVKNSGVDLIGPANNEKCEGYTADGTTYHYKPIGLLQQYGEDNLIHFGLLTGSYTKNLSGGVLRKNMGSITDEVNLDDGTFKAPPANGGIIHTLDTLRLVGYYYNDGTYHDSESSCVYGVFQCAPLTQGKWQNWGNPISEIYLEALRYLAGDEPTPAFETDDTVDGGALSTLTTASWEDPLSNQNYCANLNVIAFNASVSSYDDDQMSGVSDLGATQSAQELTKEVGDGEGITGGSYFIGENGTNNDKYCTPKTISSLGQATGICPEAPTQDGSYLMDGVAWYAHTHDIRPTLQGTQEVRTFAVALATNVPKIQVPIPGGKMVTILPAYRLVNKNTAGTLMDFKILQPYTVNAPGIGPLTGLSHASNFYTGKFYANFDDSEFGGDFDQDVWGILRYELYNDGGGWKITVQTEAMAQSTTNGQLFGFVISGTTQDGFHAYSGVQGGNFGTNSPLPGDTRPTDSTGVPGCNNCRADSESGGQQGPQQYTFTVGDGSAKLLESPLYYAAKWGGFDDENGNGKPDLHAEWDQKDANGNIVPGGDGVPDNYFFVTNPAGLERSLKQVFEAIIQKTGSGTAAAVVANTQTGTGAAFQALYEPLKKDSANREVKWIGTLHALWIDDYGLLREDNPGGTPNGILEDYQTDPVVRVFYDTTDGVTKIERFTSSDPNTFVPSGSTILPLSQLSPIWDASDELSAVSDVVDQRQNYTDPAEGRRYITTWIDSNHNGVVDPGEQVPFDSADVTSSNYGFFNMPSLAAAQTLVDYIRGKEIAGLRSRTIDLNGDGTAEVARLGDIIHSTPTPVQAPSEAFDLLYGDTSYAQFRAQYANRRQVVIVGANDGMVHAFNAGVYDPATKTFKPDGQPLGSELWAYVPGDLLPQLKWLEDPQYTHVYYVDAKPRVFDAKVFPADATHPDGWGTLLVIGMRLGGGPITVDTAANGFNAGDPDDETFRSAYSVLDITDPDQPPKLLAEIRDPALGYTTSYPAVVRIGGSTDNRWYLAFGSGPTDLSTATSTQNAHLFVYEMSAGSTSGAVNFTQRDNFTLADADAFVGDPVTTDWDLNEKADAVYFGTASGTAADPGGQLYRLPVDEKADATTWGAPEVLLAPSPGQPFLTQPSLTVDDQGEHWVFASTGRFLVGADRSSTTQQTLYGIIDGPPPIGSSIDGSTLVNVTNAQVLTDGSITNVTDPLNGGAPITSYSDLVTKVQNAGGWKLNFTADGTNPSARGVSTSALIGGILFTPAFTPSEQVCGAEGNSVLYGLSYNTGTALPVPSVFGTATCDGTSCPTGKLESISQIDLGSGLASSPSIHAGKSLGENKVSVVEQTSTGAITIQQASTTGGVKSAEVSWRAYRGAP